MKLILVKGTPKTPNQSVSSQREHNPRLYYPILLYVLCAMDSHYIGNATGVNTNDTVHSYAKREGIRTICLKPSGRMERDGSGAKTKPPVTRRRGERSEGEPNRSQDSPSGGRIEKVKYRSPRKGPSRNQIRRLRSTRLEEPYGLWKTSPVWPKSRSRCRSRRSVLL